MKIRLLGALCIAALQLPAYGISVPTYGTRVPAHWRGGLLVDFLDRTLYTFDGDGPDTSRCQDLCATQWPPFLAPPDAKPEKEFTVTVRADGSRQWSYQGRPLYHHIDGQGFSDRGERVLPSWHVVRLDHMLEVQ